jgi:hypothetical protein
MVISLARHDLVWLDPAQVGELDVEPIHRSTVAQWVDAGRPAVATRRDPGAPERTVRLGIPLPP